MCKWMGFIAFIYRNQNVKLFLFCYLDKVIRQDLLLFFFFVCNNRYQSSKTRFYKYVLKRSTRESQ